MTEDSDIEGLKRDISPKIDELEEKTKEKVQETPKKTKKTAGKAKKTIETNTVEAESKASKLPGCIFVIICIGLVLFFKVFLPFLTSDKHNLYVISIGVPAYRDYKSFKDIETSENDAEKISRLFNKSSKKLFNNVKIETLAEYGKATQKDILSTINKVYKKANDNDVVLIYFSGHGKKIEDDYFLLPYDSEKDDIIETGIKSGKLLGKKNIRTIVWIDACYSGAAEKDLKHGTVNLLVSSNANSYSYCNINGSDFTNEILKALEYCRADYDGNGIIDLHELSQFVGKEKNPIKNFQDLDLVECNKDKLQIPK